MNIQRQVATLKSRTFKLQNKLNHTANTNQHLSNRKIYNKVKITAISLKFEHINVTGYNAISQLGNSAKHSELDSANHKNNEHKINQYGLLKCSKSKS